MDQLEKGGCARLHADKPDSYFESLQFWKTPLAQCGNGKSDCVPFQKWVDRLDARSPAKLGTSGTATSSSDARVSAALWRRPWLRASLTLTPAARVVPRDLPRVARRRC